MKSLISIDEDCLLSILKAVPGHPPEKALTLGRVCTTCKALAHAGRAAATQLISAHMLAVREELAALHAEYTSSSPGREGIPSGLEIDLKVETGANFSPMRVLGSQLPVLPLQWTVLPASLSQKGGALAFLLGSVRESTCRQSSTEPGDSLNEGISCELRDEGHFTPLRIAVAAGVACHPGLIDRWRPDGRRAALCLRCQRWRRLPEAAHAAWCPDTVDKAMLPLPEPEAHKAGLDLSAAVDRARHRRSSRDDVEFGESDLVEWAAEAMITRSLKCLCST